MNHNQSELIPSLQEIQEKNGYLPSKSLKKLAKKINVSLNQIYAVATFYNQFRFHPLGEHLIHVCHGTACHVSGAEKVSETLQEELKIKENETTKDNKVTLFNVACLGCCSLAPCMMIDSTVYGRLTAKKTKDIINQIPT